MDPGAKLALHFSPPDCGATMFRNASNNLKRAVSFSFRAERSEVEDSAA